MPFRLDDDDDGNDDLMFDDLVEAAATEQVELVMEDRTAMAERTTTRDVFRIMLLLLLAKVAAGLIIK